MEPPIKEIPGYGGRYWAYEGGLILTTVKGELVPLKRARDEDGYLVVYFSQNSKTVKKKVHRIIGELFVSGRTRLKNEVEHKDRDRSNAAAYNPEWVTRKENMRRMWEARRKCS
jgi:hypothetical protein